MNTAIISNSIIVSAVFTERNCVQFLKIYFTGIAIYHKYFQMINY
jgi:hypothetical protein